MLGLRGLLAAEKKAFSEASSLCSTNETRRPKQPARARIFAQAGIAPISLPIQTCYKSAVLNGTNGIQAISLAAFGCKRPCVPRSGPLHAFFANTLDNTTFGNAWLGANCSPFDANLIGSLNAGNGRLYTFAHEVGHNLGLYHFDVSHNLIASGQVRAITTSGGSHAGS